MTLGGSGGGGSSGERVEGTSRAGKVYSIPARTRYLESVLGNYGTPGLPDTGNANATANSGTYVLTAVGFDGTRTTLQPLNGGLGGKSAIDGTNQFGAAGAASPDGSLAGGAGGTSLTVRPADPNYTTQMTADIAAGGVIRGAPGGGGGRGIQGARVDPAGRGAQGSPCDASGTPTGINAMGATTTAPNYASDGGAGGNAVATPAVLNGAPGYGQAYQTPPSNNPTTLLRGGGGSGGSSGNPGTTGAPGYAILTEVWASSSATAVQRQEMLAGPKTFPTAFMGFHEKTGSTSAYLAHGPCLLRTVNAEIQNGINNAGVTYGAESPWAAIEGKWPPTTGNRLWTGYDAYMSWANTAGHKVLVTFFQCAPGAAATPLSEAAATFTTTGATAGATSVPVSAVAMNIANGTVIKFASGKTVTLTAGYTSGGTSFTCSALAATLANGDTADLFRDNYGCHGGRYPPTSWSLLTNHVVAFLSRYTALYPGLIKFVECHNEPNFFFVGDERDMVDWQKTVYDAVKSVDTSIQVISPGAINGGYGPMTYMPIARAFGRVNTTVQGWQTCDLIGSHNYDTKPNELLGNGLAQPNKPYLQNSEVGILNTRSWHAALGGSITAGFVETEMGADQYASSLTDAQLCCTISSLAISAWLEGAPAFCYYMRPGDIGPAYWGANCVANFDSVCSRLIPFMGGQSCISALWVGDPTYPYYIITRADGARQSFGVADYTVPAPPPSAANFTARATGPSVVWAHDFSHAGEITAFKTGGTPGVTHAGAAIEPQQVTDPLVGHAMRFLALGAKLAVDLLASGGVGPRAMVIDDATYWPDPATAGNYYVHTTADQTDQQNNLWLVTAKSGNTLTVTWQDVTGQPMYFSGGHGIQKDWLVSGPTHVGHQSAVNWSRLFSALKADSNGIGVDDVNNAGNTLRSTHDTITFPQGSVFGYGWYGTATEQAAHVTWRPTDYGGGGVDSFLRSNLWDGNEFWVQWREKIDPRFLALNTVAYNLDNRYGHKVWMLQSQMTVPQQITGGYGPGATRFQIPTTPEPIFGMAAYSFSGGLAGRGLTTNLDGSGSVQPGSPYAATAIAGVADLPAGQAWETPSGQWVTFLLHVIPGDRWVDTNPSATGVRNTTVEMFAARQGETVYTTVFSQTNQAIIYGSSGPVENNWTSALPGYNALSFTAYLNVELGSVPPVAAYYTDFGQMIFSKATIPAPNDWPFSMPASGVIGTASTNTPNDTAADGSGFTAADVQAALVKVLGAWGSAALIRLYDVNGALVDLLYLVFGGGHGDTGYDGVIAWRASTRAWELMLAPTKVTPAGTPDTTHGEITTNRPDSQHMYFNLLALDGNEVNGPLLVQAYGSAVGSGAISASQAHGFDPVAKTWARIWDVGTTTPSTIVQAWAKDTKRQRFIRFPADNGTNYYWVDYTSLSNTWQNGTMAARIGNWGSVDQVSGPLPYPNEPAAIYDPVFDCIIAGIQWGSGTPANNLCICDASNIAAGFTLLNFSGTGPVNMGGVGIEHRTAQGRMANHTDTFVIFDTSTSPPTGYFELTRPAGAATFADLLSGTWTWVRHAFTGGPSNYVTYASGIMHFNRPQYVSELDAYLLQPSADHFMEILPL